MVKKKEVKKEEAKPAVEPVVDEEPKTVLIKMYSESKNKYADVHPDEVNNAKRDGYRPAD